MLDEDEAEEDAPRLPLQLSNEYELETFRWEIANQYIHQNGNMRHELKDGQEFTNAKRKFWLRSPFEFELIIEA